MRRLTWIAGMIGLGAAVMAGCEAPSPPVVIQALPPSQTNDESPGGLRSETPTIEVQLDEPTSDRPFSAAAAITPAQVRPGGTVTFVVRAKTADTWHIYTVDRPSGVSIQTTLDLDLPDGISAAGEWATPAAEAYPAGDCFIYHGDIFFHRQLTIAEDAAAGPVEVKCEFGYQACNDSMCLPPTTIELSANLEIVSD